MKQYLAARIRNIALTGHSDSGKTSLAEALLFKAGASDRLGKTSEGNTVCDFDPEEIKRKVSVCTAVAPFAWGSTKINLIDTPGLFDFAGEAAQGVRAAESLLIAVSGKSGVDVGTEKAYKMAKDLSKATLFFVSKLDVEHSDFYKVFEELKSTFGPSVCPIVVPYVEDQQVKCYINLIDMKAYTYDDKGEAHEVDMPDFGHRLDGLTAAVSEAVAETDESLFEKYFSGEQFTRDEIIRGVHTGVTNGSISPVLCGCSTNLQGIDMLLDCIVDLLPSPWEKGAEVAVDAEGEPVEVPCTDEAPLAAYVFKTIADPFVGKLSYVKVISGKLAADSAPINSRTGQPERLGKIIYIRGKKQEDTAYITAGDIGAVTKLAATETGDALCDPKKVLSFDPIHFPHPCLTMAIKAEAKGDEAKIASALQRLMEEDPTLAYENNAETHQQLISGLGEQHLDVLVSKLKNKFGVSVSLEVPRVAYRETIRKKVKVQGKHKKQSGGAGQFGEVYLRVEPLARGEGFQFVDEVKGGAIPFNFIPAGEKGVREVLTQGFIAGYPMQDIKVTVYDGKSHPVDSKEVAFVAAGRKAMLDALAKASPTLLEPIAKLTITAPTVTLGDIAGDLASRRGQVLNTVATSSTSMEILATVPLAEMDGYAARLNAMTQGAAVFTFEFYAYQPAPMQKQQELAAKYQRKDEDD